MFDTIEILLLDLDIERLRNSIKNLCRVQMIEFPFIHFISLLFKYFLYELSANVVIDGIELHKNNKSTQ